MIDTVLVLPTPPALLPPLSREDPVADLRRACQQAVAGLPAGGFLMALAAPTDEAHLARGAGEPLGHRVARHLLGERPFMPELALPWTAASLLEQDPAPQDFPKRSSTLLVMADGSARRGEKAPGHLHPDAVALRRRPRAGPARRRRRGAGSGRRSSRRRSCGARALRASACSARSRANARSTPG